MGARLARRPPVLARHQSSRPPTSGGLASCRRRMADRPRSSMRTRSLGPPMSSRPARSALVSADRRPGEALGTRAT